MANNIIRHTLRIKHFKLCLVFGIGYWKEVYKKESVGVDGVTHNIIIPLFRIHFGYLIGEREVANVQSTKKSN